MQTPYNFRPLRRRSRRTELIGPTTQHAAFLDIAMMFHDEAVEETFNGGIRAGELFVGTKDRFVASRVVGLAGGGEGRFLTEDDVD